ncbi:Uncharacterised protein [Candidatus Burarchaeum australiense]|nr:Uncharacterised protein [Candidatus Burarchaeum australiense]
MYLSNNQQYMLLISVLASVVQIVLFVLWYFEENPVPQKTIEQVEAIYEYAKEEKSRNTKKEEFIKRLLREGVIEEDELQKALEKLQNDEILLVHTYGEGTPDNLKKEMGNASPAISILKKLGFVRVFRQHNLFLIPVSDLPKTLRTARGLEVFLSSEIEKIWKDLQQKTQKNYPAASYKIMEKWRSGEGFKVSYVISKNPKYDIVAGFKNRHSFTPEFVAVILRKISIAQTLPPIRNTVKVKELLKKTSIEIFVSDFPAALKEKIIAEECSFKTALGISTILGLRDVAPEKIAVQLSSLDPSVTNVAELADSLISQAKEFADLLQNLGVSEF